MQHVQHKLAGLPASLAVALTACLLAGCAATPPPTRLADVGEVHAGSGLPHGYLASTDLPDSLLLLPPPPAADSAARQADEAATDLALQAPAERRAMASIDADLDWKQVAAGFSTSAGVDIASPAAPHTAMLLRRAAMDAASATARAKNHYMRTRPFVARQLGTCYPPHEAMLQKDGSYPSGHAAIGWMTALTLTALVPERADAILQRGYAYGQSRIICLAHWQSDVDAGRLMASATFARLQSNPLYQRQFQLARAEIAKLRPAAQ